MILGNGTKMITLTEKAVVKLKEISETEEIGHLTVRFVVKGGGCAGFTYDMFFEEIIRDLDEIEDIDGITVIIDPMSFQYLDEVTVDFVDSLIGAGFKFINPNATGGCGCGNSFSA